MVGYYNIHVDNENDALRIAFTDIINSFGVKKNFMWPTHHFNHMIDLIISHGIDLSDIDIVPRNDDVTDHFLVSCMLHITYINYIAPRYLPGRTIVPAINALLGGCPASSINKLLLVKKVAARVLTRSRKYDHITPILG